MNPFHAYDIRGIYNHDFTKKEAYLIGYHLVDLLQTTEIAVGRDTRESSPEIFQHLTQGINDAGADVLDLGLTTTPMVYYATIHHGLRGSVQITASHNARQYNGMKVSAENAAPVGYANGLREIERKIREKTPTPRVKQRGTIRPLCIRNEYISFLKSHLGAIERLSAVVDCSNGMASILAHDILPASYHYLYDTPDGTFPNHDPNPLAAENRKDLQNLVLTTQSDVGIMFDGDGDRVIFIDERGRFVPPDLMIAVMGLHFLAHEREKSETVLVDIRTSKSVEKYLLPLGAQVQTWRVGRAFMATKLREVDGLYGGELAGHYYFRDFSYSDSGLLAAIILLNVVAQLKDRGKTLGTLIDEINLYANSGELNFPIKEKDSAIETVRSHFKAQERPIAEYDYDGYRIEFNDWWFNIRKSNTEPLLRFLAEAKNQELLNKKIAELQKILMPFLP